MAVYILLAMFLTTTPTPLNYSLETLHHKKINLGVVMAKTCCWTRTGLGT